MGIVVLSLFDGCSGGRFALERLGVKIDKYFASEIERMPIGVSRYNFPDIIQIGDVTKVRYENGILYTETGDYEVPKIDLVMGGSPCQGFSFAGKQLNFSDPRSSLFFEWLRLCHEICPKYYFLENVKMKKEYQDAISELIGVEPYFLDSNLVSAQNRKRLYWTNIEGYSPPKDKGILLKDIVHEHKDFFVDREKSYCITASYQRLTDKDYLEKQKGQRVFEVTGVNLLKLDVPEATKKGYTSGSVGDCVDMTFLNSKTRRGRLMEDKSNCLTAASYDFNVIEELRQYIVPFDKTLQIIEKEVERGKVGFFRKDSQANRVYFIHGKAVTLCGDAGGGAAKMGQYLFGCITPDRVEKRQNGQRFNDGNKFYTLTAQDNHGILIEGYIRKLTPVECERLQTMPDDSTKYAIIKGDKVEVSKSQRYKMLGNGWTIDAICHFFSYMNFDSND